MKTPLRVLLAEDNPADAELIVRELRRAGFEPAWERVDTEEDYRARLDPALDLILSDFEMPQFGGLRALDLLQESLLEVPFIIVSGTIGEEHAVAVMKQGAADYLLKDRLARLGQAVRNALEQTRLRRQRRRGEEALRENAAFVEDVLNSLTAEVVVLDQAGVITSANAAWKRFARGNDGGDFLGQNYLETCGRSVHRSGDEEARAAAQGIRSVLEGAAEEFTMEYACHSPKERRWFQMRVTRLSGARPGVVVSHEAITKRKLAESAQQLFRDLVDQSSDAFEVVDPETGRFLDVNQSACAALGYTREEYLALTVCDVDPTVAAADWPRIAEAMRGQGMLGKEGVHRRKDGTLFPVELNARLVKLDRPYIVAVVRDVTERKRNEEALRESQRTLEDRVIERTAQLELANRHKSEFLAGMSHELRTPLNAIIGFTGTLLMKLPGPLNAGQEKQLRTVQGSARHLLSLINDLLDLAKIEAGKRELHLEPVAMREVLAEVAESLRSMAEKKGLTLEVAAPAESLTFSTDRRAVSQILLNLAGNAIKFTEQGGVTLTLGERHDRGQRLVEVRVADTGPGIAPQVRSRLFGVFEQGPARGAPLEGSGLGLHLSQNLAGLLGGHIVIETEVGQGSTFTLVLPGARG